MEFSLRTMTNVFTDFSFAAHEQSQLFHAHSAESSPSVWTLLLINVAMVFCVPSAISLLGS